MGYEIGDIARLTATFTINNTNGSINAGSSQLDVDDTTGYANNNTLEVQGAGPGGTNLYATITAISGKTVTLNTVAETTVVNTQVGETADPDFITVTVTAPDGTSGNVPPDPFATGRYRADYQILQDGVHSYKWVGTGNASGVVEGNFTVEQNAFSHLSARALFTLNDLKQFLGTVTRKDDDATLVRVANDASATIHREARREFVARNAVRDPQTGQVTVAPEARRFTIDRGLIDNRVLRVGDIAATVWTSPPQTTAGELTISARTTETSTPFDLNLADVSYQPRSRDPWEPIRDLYMPRTVPLAYQHILEVTAIWGFPTVPDDIRMAAIKLAAGTYYRDVRRWGEELQDTTINDLPRSLIGSALRTARDYRVTPPIVSIAF